MSIVNVKNVRIEEVTDPTNSSQKSLVLNYLNRQYQLVQAFPLTGLNAVQNLHKHLTEDRSQSCIIIQEHDRYSLWVEKIQKPRITIDRSESLLESVFRVQMSFIDGFLTEIRELLGHHQATAFSQEILPNIPTIRSTKDLLTAIVMAMQPDKSIEMYLISEQQLLSLDRQIQQLAGKYLGKSYAKEIWQDLQRKLPAQLDHNFQIWLSKQSR